MKLDPNKIDEVINKLRESFPDEVGNLKQAGENKLKLVLESALQRLEVVSREEYDVQTEVLQRTRARIDELERRISELEEN